MSHRGSFRFVSNRLSAGESDYWQQDGICRDDPELHFPVSFTGRASLLQIEQAKARCRRCPVTTQCLDWAIGTGDRHGVYGGTTPDERQALTRRGVAAVA